MNMDNLLNMPYVNEVTLNGQNLYLKSCKTSELKLCMLRRLRSFQRGTVGLCIVNWLQSYKLSKLEI